MTKRRQERMAVEIQRVLAQIIRDDIKDPRIDFSEVSINKIELSSDLSHAKVYVSIMGDETKQTETIQAIQKAKGYLRSELAQAIQLRHAPELDIKLDQSIEHGIRIAALLDELNDGKPQE